MALGAPDTDQLLDEAADGDAAARQQLLARHRGRLLKMVAIRLDPRLAARVDPSDVVQEALAQADRKLDDYLHDRPVPFYPWLRRIAWERLVKCHRRHTARRRDVAREAAAPLLSDASVRELAAHFLARGSSPSRLAERRELIVRARSALEQLPERDREVLVLRYLEHLSTAETAAVLEITPGAVKLRHLRAIDRLRDLMGNGAEDES
jgi:RNA polymerase sigma-70 factor, ECF subfamily